MLGFPVAPYVLVELPDTAGASVNVPVPVDFGTDTVGSLKARLRDSRGIPEAVQRLTHNSLRGGELSEHQRLDDWGPGVAFRLWRTDHARLNVWVPDGSLVQFALPKSSRVRCVEGRLRNLLLEPHAVLELSCDGVVLNGALFIREVVDHPGLQGHWLLRVFCQRRLRCW